MPEASVGVSVREALRSATAVLERAGCDTPRLDAELLLATALGTGRERLVLDAEMDLDPAALAQVGRLVARRCGHEPVAYITGHKEFRHIGLSVDSRVLIPRPETELLVEVGLSLPERARVLDLGTGSGAVALALKHERPDLEVWGSDVSAAAIAVASENARRLGLEVRFAQGDLLDGAPAGLDAVLANLPYVAEDAQPAPEISYEPRSALFAGADGLDVIRRLAAIVADVALVALEVGAGKSPEVSGQAPEVSALLRRTGFRAIDVLRDLAGHERVVVARR